MSNHHPHAQHAHGSHADPDPGPTAQIEIERKYLLTAAPDLTQLPPGHVFSTYTITQGYVNAETASPALTPHFAELLACPAPSASATAPDAAATSAKWIRIRSIEQDRQPPRCIITYKTGSGAARLEREQPISQERFAILWPGTAGKRLRKRRYRALSESDRSRGINWVIDDFLDRSLVLLEVELTSLDTTYNFPDWLAPHVDREVTDEASYTNLSLAR
ncbi:MAG: hypothetical protein D8M59_13040 [Planctomycetes bacterium]|nr:hypothetical protein [Planctomycetota bacterium]NOG54931.1 hypothetical protein [Planctomycetota bacterium]